MYDEYRKKNSQGNVKTTNEDGWDWALLMYIALTVLKIDYGCFLNMQPKLFFALVDCHQEMNSKTNGEAKSKPKAKERTTIDKLGFM